MATAVVRFNLVLPGLDRQRLSDMHRAALDMAAHCDEQGFAAVSLEEHHGADNGWSPSPLALAGMVFGRTKAIGVNISALLLPLHDPLRVAEDIAVLDLASGGRLSVVFGLGYRPSEYTNHGKDWSRRGRLMDEAVQAVLDAWTGEPFVYRGETVRVTPPPLTQPHPMVFLGGTSPASARRAARFGLPFFMSANLPDLEKLYYDECAANGTTGLCMMPATRTVMTFVAEDPDRAWAEIGHHFLHEALTYADWQPPGQTSSVTSHARTVDDLRAEGIYQVVTPKECVEQVRDQGAEAFCLLHPLCGGMPIDTAWESVQLFTDQVWPHVRT
jgi:alkanesulfonate monooxygenase SsuD/methylene tetrahydromethanopterin reductase-like flavin-dependent oxidoreductase (luciferase family)